LNKSKF